MLFMEAFVYFLGEKAYSFHCHKNEKREFFLRLLSIASILSIYSYVCMRSYQLHKKVSKCCGCISRFKCFTFFFFHHTPHILMIDRLKSLNLKSCIPP